MHTMFLLYLLGICLALSTSHLTRVERVSCARYEAQSTYELQPGQPTGLDAKEEHVLRLEILKQKILKKLGLKEAPQVDARLSSRIASKEFSIFESKFYSL